MEEPVSAGYQSSPGDGRRSSGLALLLAMPLLTVAWTAAAQAVPPAIDDLIAKAARHGTIRVVVEVRAEAPGPPTPDAIARAQDLVLQELAGTDHRVLRRFTTIPFLGLAVSADALRRLAGSPLVSGIREDRILRPQGSTGSP